jgi:uncharacterized protein
MQISRKTIFALECDNSKLLLSNIDNPDIIEGKNPYLFSALKKLGVFVNQIDEEFAEIKKINNKEIYSKKYRLTLIPTLECNLNCWYCYETHIKSSISDVILNSILKFIESLFTIDEIEELELDWFGGEPLMRFNDIIFPFTQSILKICQLHNIKLTQVITTNGSLVNTEMVNSFREIGLNNFQITLDGKRNIHNKIRKDCNNNGTFDLIINAVNLICEIVPNAEVLLRINYTNKSILTIHEIVKDFPIPNRSKIKLLFQQVWQLENKNEPVNLDAYYELFRKEGFKVERNRFNEARIACYADKLYQSVINYNGDVFKCTARDFADRTNRNGYLNNDGIILWDSNLHKMRFQKSSIENEFCSECKFVPLCFGPCSQKRIELSNMDKQSFDRICHKAGLLISVEREMIEFYERTFGKQLNL